MYLSEIMEKLSTKLSISTTTIGHNVQIYGVLELLPGEVSEPAKGDLLYFVHDAGLLQGTLPQSIVCATPLPDAVQGQVANVIQVSPAQYDTLLAAMRDLLNDAYRLQALHSSMLQMIFDGRGVSGILSSIADRADSSIVVINMGGKILAHSAPFRLKEPLWAQSVQQGYCPAEFMEHIRTLRQADASQLGAGPYVRYCEEMGLYYLCSKITRDGALFGYVFMIQPDESFGPDCYETLSLVSKTLTETTLKNQDRITLHTYLYGEILTDMLNGISQKQASTRIQIGKLAFPSYMRVLAVRPLYYHGESVLTGDVQARLEALFSAEQSVVYQKSVVLLIDVQKNRAIPQPQLDGDAQTVENLKGIGCVPHGKGLAAQRQTRPAEGGKIVLKTLRPRVVIVFQQLLVKLQAEVLHGLPPSADMPVFPAVADQVKQGHDLLIAVSVLPRAVFQPLDIPGFPGDPVALAEKCGVQEVRVQLCVQLFRQPIGIGA